MEIEKDWKEKIHPLIWKLETAFAQGGSYGQMEANSILCEVLSKKEEVIKAVSLYFHAKNPLDRKRAKLKMLGAIANYEWELEKCVKVIIK